MADIFANKFKTSSSRLQNFDYSSSGIYFITICTLNHNNFFGKIINNQMELSGPIGALVFIKKLARQDLTKNIEIFSDSKYVILGITEWIFNWQKNNWRNAAKKPVLNKELWVELHSLTKDFNIKWTYVKGHAGFEWNERVDVIATSFADNEPVI